ACVSLAILASNLESVEIDPRALPTAPIRLTMPPTGSVEVEIVRDGSIPVFVEHLQIGETSSLDANGLPAWTGGLRWPERIDEGRAEFDHVGLGLELYATTFERGFPQSVQRARGPTVAGERVKLRYDLGHGYPVVVFHVVDAERQPIPEKDFSVMIS